MTKNNQADENYYREFGTRKVRFFMMMNKTSKIVIIGSITCSLVLLGVLSTFAYFVLTGTSKNEEISVQTGDLALTFSDGNNGITQALEFDSSIEKTFTIENSGSLDAVAKINFVDLINTYLDKSLTYSLSYSETENGIYKDLVINENVPRSEASSTKELANGLEIPSKTKYFYKLTITLNYLNDINQTADLKAIFSSHFNIEEGNTRGLVPKIIASIIKKTDLPKSDYIHLETSPDFSQVATTDEGIFAMEDDYGTSYYFRGAVENNYVKFGSWSNDESVEKAKREKPMYWRIIRVNGDGSVRIIYDGTQAHANGEGSEDRVAFSAPWNVAIENYRNDAKYVGYMFGGTNSTTSNKRIDLDKSGYVNSGNAIYNETDSNMKIQLEDWYEINILGSGLDDYVSDKIFCNDRSIPGKEASGWTYDTALGYGSNATAYGAYARLGINQKGINYNNPAPQFTCPNRNDAFTKDDTIKGNGKLSQKVGLITADEAFAAGGNHVSYNSKYYLYKISSWYRTMTPFYKSSGSTGTTFAISSQIQSTSIINYGPVAPVISLAPEYFTTLIGDGTAENPYREKDMEP